MKFIILGSLLTIGASALSLPRQEPKEVQPTERNTTNIIEAKSKWPCVDQPYCAMYTDAEARLECRTPILQEVMWMNCPTKCGFCKSGVPANAPRMPGWPCQDQPYCSHYTTAEARLECKTPILNEMIMINCPTKCGLCKPTPTALEKNQEENFEDPLPSLDFVLTAQVAESRDQRLPGWPCVDQPYCKLFTDAEARLECKTPILNELIMINCPTRCGLCKTKLKQTQNSNKNNVEPISKALAVELTTNEKAERKSKWPCVDQSYCAQYTDAEARLECRTPILQEVMWMNCPTRCGFCKTGVPSNAPRMPGWPCQDQPFCAQYTAAEARLECKTPILNEMIMINCPTKCGLCKTPTAVIKAEVVA